MGIHLDWESDSPPGSKRGISGGSYVAREDPEQRRRRRRARLRAIVVLGVLALLLIAVAAIITWRLAEANAFIESLLRDTVEAEFAALRLGDWNAYADIQRSATDDWTLQQRVLFDTMQQQKLSGAIDLTGTVRDLEIDGTRARVMVEWLESGTPVTQAWFYWRYEDVETDDQLIAGGWRHVPPDLTFWGGTEEDRGSLVTVVYRDVDAPLAHTMRERVEGWISSTCGPILQCGDVPHITLDIRADFYLDTHWEEKQPWRLLIPSPYVEGARSDQPFDGDTRRAVADAIATRLVTLSLGTTTPFDRTSSAGLVVSSARDWLHEQFTESRTASPSLINSLIAQRGAAALGQLLKSLTPDSTLDAVLTAFDTTSPTDAAIDWSGYLRQRILLESDLLMSGNLDAVSGLYVEEMRSRAQEASQALAARAGVDVRLVQAVTAPDGSPALIATVIFGSGENAREESLYFYWRGGQWLRAS